MNILTILALLVLVATAIIIFAIWLNKKGITKDENDNYVPDAVDKKVDNVKSGFKNIIDIIKGKK
tara:strand:+ start:704 stop:898 length:195 start_codon:yes stop_codon:yes gene_type:complete